MLKIIALCLGLISTSVLAMENLPSGKIKEGLIGQAAVEFNLPMALGGEKSLTRAREGKKAVVLFWATWCPHCREEIARVNENAEAIGQKGIKILLVDLGETPGEVAAYLQHNKINLDSFVDADNSLQEPYQLVGVPTLVFIDEDGLIRGMTHGFPSNYEELFAP